MINFVSQYLILHAQFNIMIFTCTCSSQPSYKPLAHLIVWGFAFTCGAVLMILTLSEVPGEAGILWYYTVCLHMCKALQFIIEPQII